MTRQSDPEYPHFMFQHYTPSFEEVDYTTFPTGPFDFTVPLQALEQEAIAKGSVVVVQVSLIPIADLFPENPVEEGEKEDEQEG